MVPSRRVAKVGFRVGRGRATVSGAEPSDGGCLGKSGERPKPEIVFREVDFDEVGRVEGPHYYRGRSFVIWVGDDTIAGAFPTAPQQIEDLPPVRTLYARLCPRPTTRCLHSDLRGFGSERLVFEALLTGAAAQFTVAMAARTAAILPSDWSRAWWIGVLAMRVIVSTPIRGFADSPSAWAWLGAPPELLAPAQRLTADLATDVSVTRALSAHLQADPTLTLEGAARLLGSSTRSLQRVLQTTGESFAELRDRARAEIAAARLADSDDKVDAVAADTGFRSRSHFVTWFRRLTGFTPAAFRAQHRRR